MVVNIADVNQLPVIEPVDGFDIDENAAIDTVVGTIVATDEDDGDTLTFSITDGNDNGAFAIDDTTGAITVANSDALDAEAQAEFTLTIRVADNGNPVGEATTTVTIDVNDLNEAPVFLDEVGGEPLPDGEVLNADPLAETAASGDAVITVEATDDDAGDLVAYSIVSGNESGAFAIDSATGAITVADASQIDADTNPSFTLTVQARDNNGALSLSDQVDVVVNIADVNQLPVIDPVDGFDIDENSATGTLVGTISAIDEDDGDTLTFSILGGNDNGAFEIDSLTGAITVANSDALNSETQGSFELEVGVTDDGNPVGTDSETVTITVNDLNEAPVFLEEAGGDPLDDGETLTATPVSETAVNDDPVITVVAEDDDGDIVAYSIVTGNDSGAFAIDSATGEITVSDADQINFDTTPSFTLTVQARDNNGAQSLADQVDVVIDVANVNRAPVFDPVDDFSLPENSANGTILGSVIATDVDQGDTLIYEITGGTGAGVFDINDLTGEITLSDSAALDFEETPQFDLEVTVTDNGEGRLSDQTTVTINVTNFNEAPVFLDGSGGTPLPDGTVLTTAINEDLNAGDSVFQLFAEDDDAGDILRYRIIGGNEQGVFNITSTSGEITIANTNNLNFDITPSFTLTVEVEDDNGAASLSDTVDLVIDINDVNEIPSAEDATFNVNENAADGTTVGTVIATDADNSNILSYSITGGDPDGVFAINPDTGGITVANGSLLDHEAQDVFTLTVTVDDGVGGNDDATITVDVNDVNEAPFLTVTPPILTNVSETAAIGDTVANISADFDDPDEGDTRTFAIIGGNGQGVFNVSNAGIITVADASLLDAEVVDNYEILVQATDSGGLTVDALVSIDVDDVNEPPTVEDLTINVDEGTANGSVLDRVIATDPENDGLTFEITAGNQDSEGDDVFRIDENTGQITVLKSEALDSESADFNPYVLTVEVSDGDNTQEATVTININDINEQPVIQNTTFEILENSPNSTIVGNLDAIDPDGDTLSFTILGGDPNGVFAVNPDGNITVANSALLNLEDQSAYTLTVRATDNAASPLSDTRQIVISVLDVNEPPAVGNFNFIVDENSSDGTFVGIIAADDPEDAELEFSIDPGTDVNGAFAIDEDDGTITVNNGAFLDAETNDVFVLSVDVSDGENTSTSEVTITINGINEAPTFPDEPVSFTVREDSTNGVVVGQVQASDIDEGQTLTYEIIGGNTDGAFAVNPGTGQITVANAAALDFETNPSFTLTVQATDNGANPLSATEQVLITVSNINETPVIEDGSFTIDEQPENDAVVGTITAFDPDGDELEFSIIDGDDTNIFDIESTGPNTAEIVVPTGVDLQFAESPVFFLTVQVTDEGSPELSDTAVIQVNVNNVNEPPVFVDEDSDPTDTYNFDAVNEDAPVGTVVGQVFAEDADGDDLLFAITAGDPDSVFEIDAITGEIRVAGPLDFEVLDNYELTVDVTDGIADSPSDTATVNINLANINEAPVISTVPNEVTFFFVTSSGSNTLGDIVASDPDDDDLTFEVIGGTGVGIFDFADANSPTLELVENAPINLLFPDRFTLAVQATDNGEGNLTSQAVELQTFIAPIETQVLNIGSAGNDVILGSNGADLIFGDDGDDELFGGLDDDVISGDAGNDFISGQDGNDQLFGGGGDDLLAGNVGNDTMYGRGGNDTLGGGQGDDQIFGNAGDDRLEGRVGNDRLEGGLGNDRLLGEDGNDELIGVSLQAENRGRGEFDVLRGLGGADRLILGDENGVFYDDGNIGSIGTEDYARITELDAEDRIQLAGSIGDYQFSEGFALDDRTGTGILWQGEFIALVVDRTAAETQAALEFV